MYTPPVGLSRLFSTFGRAGLLNRPRTSLVRLFHIGLAACLEIAPLGIADEKAYVQETDNNCQDQCT